MRFRASVPSSPREASRVTDAFTSESRTSQHLVSQLRCVTRISLALSSAVSVEDVYSVLLSGLISPLGLGYSQAIVFENTAGHCHFVGRYCVALESQGEAEELRADLEAEVNFLTRRKEELLQRGLQDESAVEELRMLELGSQWVTVFQRLATDSPRSRTVSALVYSENHPQCDPHGRGLFRQAMLALSPQVIRKRDEEIALPEDLSPLLADEFAMIPLRTNKGLRALILLDRRLTGEAIINPDLEQLDWFATQGALALQNAELINDLEHAYQELKAVDQLKSNFLSTISHELRTPLTAITGFVDLIRKERVGEVNDGQRDLLERVARNTGHLNNIVTDLIEVAEIEAEGMSDLRIEAVDPLHVLFATFPRLDNRRRDQRVSIEPVMTDSIPAIQCDQRALERIYFHLLDNAMKFSPPDGVVQVEFQRAGTRLRISIHDKGVGIPPDKLQRIFDQFYQVDSSLTRGHEGLGLGLAVTRMLVQATHGDIEVESSPGKGSTFTLSYPLSRSGD